jgi:hypothetical protein
MRLHLPFTWPLVSTGAGPTPTVGRPGGGRRSYPALWPSRRGGIWRAVCLALWQDLRGLPGGDLLARRRGRRNRAALPRLTERLILSWAERHQQRTGERRTQMSGAVGDAPGENWKTLDSALRRGWRGLRGGTTLAELLARRRGRRPHKARPELSAERVLAWAQAYRTLYGAWPTVRARAVGGTGETWLGLDLALRNGNRGLPGGSSLSRLLKGGGMGGRA